MVDTSQQVADSLTRAGDQQAPAQSRTQKQVRILDESPLRQSLTQPLVVPVIINQ